MAASWSIGSSSERVQRCAGWFEMSAVFSMRDPPPERREYNGERLLIFDAESLLIDPSFGIQHSLLDTLQQLDALLHPPSRPRAAARPAAVSTRGDDHGLQRFIPGI